MGEAEVPLPTGRLCGPPSLGYSLHSSRRFLLFQLLTHCFAATLLVRVSCHPADQFLRGPPCCICRQLGARPRQALTAPRAAVCVDCGGHVNEEREGL